MTETATLIAEATRTALDEARAAATLADLREVRVRALGRKAPMSRVRAEMGSLSEDDRREIGRDPTLVPAPVASSSATRTADSLGTAMVAVPTS